MSSRFRAVIAAILLVALATPPLVYSGSSDRKRNVRTTAYTHSESDHIKYGRKTALGTQLKRSTSYTSAAADWSRFPVGTTFRMKGSRTNYVIDDYGSALVGTDTIDIYHTSKGAMNRWGVRHVDIEITKWGDYEKSREILSQRTKYKHCRQMYAAIPKNTNDSKRGWFWNRKPKDSAPAPDPAPAPTLQPQRAPEPAAGGDIMLASNDGQKNFGIRHWFSGRGKADADSIETSDGPIYDFHSTPSSAPAPSKPVQPEIQRSEPQSADIMLASNETERSKGRWQWLRKLVGRDSAADAAPAPADPIPAPTVPTQPEIYTEQPEPAIMLASHTAERSEVPAPKPAAPVNKPAPAPVPAPTPVPAAPAPAPATAPVVLASAKVDQPTPPVVRSVEPIAIARTSTPGLVKVSNTAESAPRRVVFAVARPDSPVPHRKREVRALPAGWKPGA